MTVPRAVCQAVTEPRGLPSQYAAATTALSTAYAASTTSARTAAAHSSSSSPYKARSSVLSQPPVRTSNALISAFTTAAERTPPEAEGLGDMTTAYGPPPKTHPPHCQPHPLS